MFAQYFVENVTKVNVEGTILRIFENDLAYAKFQNGLPPRDLLPSEKLHYWTIMKHCELLIDQLQLAVEEERRSIHERELRYNF